MIRKGFVGLMVLALALLWVTVPRPATAQVGGSMEGDFFGPDGQPMADVIVLIERQDIKQHFETKTDKKGHWFHAGLPLSQSYIVTFKHGDQVMWIMQRVVVRLGDTTRVDVNLKQEMERARRNPPQETEEQRKRRETAEKQRASFEELKKRFEQGVAYLNNKQFDLAATEFEACAQVDPTQYVVFGNLGEAYNGLRRYDDSVSAYQKAISMLEADLNAQDKNIRLAGYHNNLGGVLGRAGKTQEAMAEFEKAAQLDPPGAGRYYFNMGAIMVNTGKTDEAVEAFRKAIATDANYADAYYQLGVALTGKATTDKSGNVIPAPGTIEALQKYLELQPQGRYAQAAKDLLTGLTGQVQTEVSTRKTRKK